MLSEIVRTTMAERFQDAATRASMAGLQRAQEENEKKDRIQETNVTETPEAQSEHVDEEAKRRNPYVQKRKKKSKSPEDVEEKLFYTEKSTEMFPDDPDAHSLDVTT
jgi:hypothetical protein